MQATQAELRAALSAVALHYTQRCTSKKKWQEGRRSLEFFSHSAALYSCVHCISLCSSYCTALYSTVDSSRIPFSAQARKAETGTSSQYCHCPAQYARAYNAKLGLRSAMPVRPSLTVLCSFGIMSQNHNSLPPVRLKVTPRPASHI